MKEPYLKMKNTDLVTIVLTDCLRVAISEIFFLKHICVAVQIHPL